MIEPAIVHIPCPKMLANAYCMIETPSTLLTSTQKSAGDSAIARYAARNP